MNAVLLPGGLDFRPMEQGDVDAIMQIEVRAYPHPWTGVIFRDCLKAGYPGIIASSEGQMIGYAMLSVAAGESHLLNLCVAPGYQGRGFGRQLLHRVFIEATEKGAQVMFLEVRASNSVAQSLYLDSGFNQIGTRRGYYPDDEGREDALIFARQLLQQELD
ncbi:MAG: ribosomal protein S18-alanine N-acetyltransferase [Sedimenticolaceae bacterium]|nr:ribosomal protein S18-alanine N-acetyltransferase [Sedimenticolaceae bacterium]